MDAVVAANYGTYRKWFEWSLGTIWRLPKELLTTANPMVEIAKAEQESSKRAVKSLSIAIRDTLAMTDRYSDADIQTADASFESAGLPSLTSIKAIFSKNISRVIAAGIIKSEADYYSIKNLQDAEIPDDLKKELEKLIGAYEIKKY